MYSKTQIFNLALGTLLLSKRIVDADTDTSTEGRVLQTHWDAAFWSTLEDLNLNRTSSTKVLELIEENPNQYWSYGYKYPDDCVFLRRVLSCQLVDDRNSHIPKETGIKDGRKMIFTNEENASISYLSSDIPISALPVNAGLATAYRLASLSSPLVTGKGAAALIAMVETKYVMAKTAAQRADAEENFNYVDPRIESEFVAARMK